MPTSQNDLVEADRHIAEGDAQMARHREMVSGLRRDGHAVAADQAEGMLGIMEQALDELRRDRATIASQLVEAAEGGADHS